MSRSKGLSDTVKAVAVTNASLSATFAATGQPILAGVTGAEAAAGIAVDLVTQKLHERNQKK